MKKRKEFASFVRNFVFGVEDSLVSTVGLLSGIAVAGLSRQDIFLTGIVLIFVEAFSMGVGSYLSESSVDQFNRVNNMTTIVGGIIMFFSYFVAGFVPLAPYLIFDVKMAFPVSIIFSLIALFVLGTVSASLNKSTSFIKQGLRMFILGGMAIAVGVIVGKFVHGA